MTDYGHAMALVDKLRRRAESSEKAGQGDPEMLRRKADDCEKRIAEADWRCRECGAVSVTAKVSACEHRFWNYEMVEADPGSGRGTGK